MDLINVAPIGTCRIHSPLRRAATSLPFNLNLARNYGYVHTSAEVLQQLDLMTGGKPVPKPLWPFIYRPNTTDEFFAQPLCQADLFFFEISSAKHITVDDVPIQLNYLTRYFDELFSDREFARQFWLFARSKRPSDIQPWLRTIPQFTKLNEEHQALLTAIRMREQSAEEIAADMAKIVDRVSADKMIFVTHVDGLTPANTPIATRQRLIELVTDTANKLHVRCFNPTEEMVAFGQNVAMERQGLDLTHYTLPFADHLGKIWFNQFIRTPNMAVDAACAAQNEQAQARLAELRRLVEQGQLIEASHRLHAAIRAGDSNDELKRLHARLAFALGDFAQVVSILQTLAKANGLLEEDDALLLNAYLAQGDDMQAITLGRLLLADERETDDILEACEQAAQNLGLLNEALSYQRRLRQNREETVDPAIHLTQLFQAENYAEADRFAERILSKIANNPTALMAKWRAALGLGNYANLLQLVDRLAALNSDVLLELVQETCDHNQPRPAAALLNMGLQQYPTQQNIVERANQLSSDWQAASIAAIDADDWQHSAALLNASMVLHPASKAVTKLHRLFEKKLRIAVREAFSAKDHQRVLMLADIASSHNITFNGLDQLAGRAAAELNQPAIALAYFSKAVVVEPTPAIRIHLARTATKYGQYEQALLAYNNVIDDLSANPEQHSAALRAVNNMHTVAIRAAREATLNGKADLAWTIIKLLAVHSDRNDHIQREQIRIVRHLRRELVSTDAADYATRLKMANNLLELDPTDISVRRIAANAAMRTMNFYEAREHWQILAQQTELTPQIIIALERCERSISGHQTRKAA
jgi:hypothetical protein